ncbi:hypothetical protein CEXT_264811 [Caerostris extrusa]|uniref:Uncharacterized protein n=1 Tax=Caerostris extrusa TaxID=172846 RepID=A0AAV4T953_CAEEX|nr:hypothetical protein CEXT_264811 [Caerostris extrusa]
MTWALLWSIFFLDVKDEFPVLCRMKFRGVNNEVAVEHRVEDEDGFDSLENHSGALELEAMGTEDGNKLLLRIGKSGKRNQLR